LGEYLHLVGHPQLEVDLVGLIMEIQIYPEDHLLLLEDLHRNQAEDRGPCREVHLLNINSQIRTYV
jgi:hypothetical protein